ncbi:MAG: hypothetical protein ACYDH6_19315 [Acidimicrobiales bacterium]
MVAATAPELAWASICALTGRGGHGCPARSTGHVGPAVTNPYAPAVGGGTGGPVDDGALVGAMVVGATDGFPMPMLVGGATLAATVAPDVTSGATVATTAADDGPTTAERLAALAQPTTVTSTISASHAARRGVFVIRPQSREKVSTSP